MKLRFSDLSGKPNSLLRRQCCEQVLRFCDFRKFRRRRKTFQRRREHRMVERVAVVPKLAIKAVLTRFLRANTDK
jgi:hypothetical protein